MSTTSWQHRPVPEAMTDERLAALVDAEVERSERMLFTLTPREELDAIGRAQQLADQAFAQQVRAIAAAHSRSVVSDREFAVDELALALGVGFGTAANVLQQALALAALPGMVEAIHAGLLTQRHALAVLRELDAVELSVEHRIAIATIVLARMVNHTPGELAKLTRRLILTIDLAAAQARQDAAALKKRVLFWNDVDGQAVIHAKGPMQQIAAVKAAMARWLKDNPVEADDPRSASEREFDLFVALLTGGTEPGSWQAQVIVPFSTADGAELELAEIPGFGPILPSTAQELLQDAEWSQVAVDQDGVVIAVSDPIPAPRKPAPCPLKAERLAELRRLIAQPPPERLMPERLAVAGYVTTSRLKRYLQARDRHCVFPGCHRRITDVDHRIPWPLGPTAAWNLELLCRHHHRAKQAVFTVELTTDGDYLWTHRSGWQFLRHRQGY